jgi:hypothetical protein
MESESFCKEPPEMIRGLFVGLYYVDVRYAKVPSLGRKMETPATKQPDREKRSENGFGLAPALSWLAL